MENLHNRISKCVPQRYVMVTMCCLAALQVFTIKISLFLLILQMQNNSNTNSNKTICPVISNDKIIRLELDHTNKFLFSWNQKIQDLIFYSFYWGYISTQLLGGSLADSFGGKYLLGFGIFGASILTLITPLIILITRGNYDSILILRILQGLCEGTTLSAINALLAQWIPPNERTTMTSIVFAGGHLCGFINALIFTQIFNKTTILYSFGVFGLIWCIAWQLLCYSNPDFHFFISRQEREYLRRVLSGHVNHKRKQIPIKEIICCAPLRALIFAEMGYQWTWFIFIKQVPKYMKEVLNINPQERAMFLSLPLLMLWVVAIAFGCLCDSLINGRHLSTTAARKIFTTLGAITSTGLMIVGSYEKCNELKALIAYAAGLTLMGFYYAGIKVNTLDLAPNFAGTLMAIVNCFAVPVGLFASFLTEIMTPHNTLFQWGDIFWLNFFFVAFTIYVYVIYGNSKEQTWNNQI